MNVADLITPSDSLKIPKNNTSDVLSCSYNHRAVLTLNILLDKLHYDIIFKQDLCTVPVWPQNIEKPPVFPTRHKVVIYTSGALLLEL